jgi:hypothetical protein
MTILKKTANDCVPLVGASLLEQTNKNAAGNANTNRQTEEFT